MKTIRSLIAAALITSSITPALAASQGVLGTTSTGTAEIRATVANLASISNLNDFIFPTWTGSGDLILTDNVCVYVNNRGGRYQLTASGNGRSGFNLTDGAGNPLTYEAQWNTRAASGGESLRSGQTLRSRSNADTSSIDCSSGRNLNSALTITLREAALRAAPAGNYAGVITLTVAPE
ncbi:MAG: hypothetical protein LW855_05530 [Alphaproteobacteria bacterium]|jgi:hypothetical protein|nr:hypothetical protein [Alphaproteobacteria bacterium]